MHADPGQNLPGARGKMLDPWISHWRPPNTHTRSVWALGAGRTCNCIALQSTTASTTAIAPVSCTPCFASAGPKASGSDRCCTLRFAGRAVAPPYSKTETCKCKPQALIASPLSRRACNRSHTSKLLLASTKALPTGWAAEERFLQGNWQAQHTAACSLSVTGCLQPCSCPDLVCQEKP